jgi:aldose sugar dehydrogenase
MAFYTGKAFPGWQGSIRIDSLRPGLLVQLTLEDGRVTGKERYLGDLRARIRDGRLLRVLPAAPR